MKIWIVISGVDYEDCQNIEGCFQSLLSAENKVSELKNQISGKWENDYVIFPKTKEKVISPFSWSNEQDYLEIQEHDLLP